MDRKHNKYLTPLAKELRKNMTKEEKHLWYDFLNSHHARFTKQKVLGNYIADFYSAKANLVIELDGSQHGKEENAQKDDERTKYLEEYGIQVLRFQNYEITNNFKNVCEYIDKITNKRMKEENIMTDIDRTKWFQNAGYGLFVHWTSFSLPENATEKDLNKPYQKRLQDYFNAVEEFDVPAFCSQVVETGAKFLFITTSHADLHLPFPLKTLDDIVPNHTSKRDLIGEISDELAKHDIKLLLYFNGEGSTDPDYQNAVKFHQDPKTHAEYCYKITEAISKKYGNKIAGWWIDCCYEIWADGRGKRYDYKRYADALRAGNPNSIVAFNFRGVDDWGSEWGRNIADFQAGEENDLINLPTHRFSGESGLQWFALCWMDDYWVHEKIGTPTPAHSNEKVLDYIKKVIANEGVFAYNVAPYRNGKFSDATMEQLKFIKNAL